jgi:hypothetical protein
LSTPGSTAARDEEMEPWPFAGSAYDLRSRGLTVLPVGGDDGKTPLVRWRTWSRRPSAELIDKLLYRHPDANIGVICHLSRVTVVDIDDPSLLESMLDRFGNTPLITRTPSGGCHFWYRHAGERCTNLRGGGLDVDIKAKGGFVVVPPSEARQGRHTGKPYVFERGSWSDLGRLPKIHADSLPRSQARGGGERSGSPGIATLRSIPVGRRNDTLFATSLREVRHCDTIDDLIDKALHINDSNLEEPLPAAEVEKIAHSAWDYDQRGGNWVGREARAVIDRSTFEILQQNPDAYVLWTKLKFEHGARKEPFALCLEAMGKGEVIRGWRDKRRYRKARDWLVEQGFLDQIHLGGRAAGDPHLFRLSTPRMDVESRGAPHGC